jgi:predicted DNA-binding WGR domain protein
MPVRLADFAFIEPGPRQGDHVQRYEFNDDKSSKFWQIEQQGSELHIAWGKIGTQGQSQVKAFDDAAKAEAAKAKLIAEKTRKG